MIAAHKPHLASDRTSCHRWEANQVRLPLHTAAYWLMLDLRAAAPRKSRRRTATFETIRTTCPEIAARIEALIPGLAVLDSPLTAPHPRMGPPIIGKTRGPRRGCGAVSGGVTSVTLV